jgi:hypothetical protein
VSGIPRHSRTSLLLHSTALCFHSSVLRRQLESFSSGLVEVFLLMLPLAQKFIRTTESLRSLPLMQLVLSAYAAELYGWKEEVV